MYISAQTSFTGTYSFAGVSASATSMNYNGTSYAGLTFDPIKKTELINFSSSGQFYAAGWPASVDNTTTKYFEFTVNPTSGYVIDLSEISFNIGRSNNSAVKFQIRSSVDNYATALSNYTTLASGLSNSSGVISMPESSSTWSGNVLTLNSVPALQNITSSVTFRLYFSQSFSSLATAGLATSISLSGSYEKIVWGNLQWPQNASINFFQTADIYGQTYISDITEAAGQGTGIQSWTGINSSNTNPNTWAESAWKSATFVSQEGNNDQFKTTVGFISETGDNYILPGTYYYATRYQYQTGSYVYGGNNLNSGANAGGIWDGSTYKSGTLTVLTQVMPDMCGTTFAHENNRIDAIPVNNATHYKFKFVNGATSTEIVSTSPGVTFAQLGAALEFGVTYQVSVAWSTDNGATYTAYGEACGATLANPVNVLETSKVLTSQCGTTMDHSNNLLYAEARTGATSWKFKFVEGSNTQEITRSSNDVAFASLGSALKYNTNYSISVSYEKDGVWSAYGPACDVMVGDDTYVTVGCDATYSANERIEALPILNATEYTFEFNSDGTSFATTNPYVTFPQASIGAGTYSVKVKAKVDGVYGDYSKSCNVSFSPAAALANARVMVYPNPFTQGFTIDTSNMKQASITIYDQNSMVKEQHNVTAPNQSLKMGTTLAKGLYFVHVTENGNTEVYQVIKK